MADKPSFQNKCPVCLDGWKTHRLRAGWDNILPYEIWECGACGCIYQISYTRPEEGYKKTLKIKNYETPPPEAEEE